MTILSCIWFTLDKETNFEYIIWFLGGICILVMIFFLFFTKLSDGTRDNLGWATAGASFVFIAYIKFGLISYLYKREIDNIYSQKSYAVVEGEIYGYKDTSRRKYHAVVFYVNGIKFNGRTSFDRELYDSIKVRIKYAANTVKYSENTILEIEDIDCVLPKL